MSRETSTTISGGALDNLHHDNGVSSETTTMNSFVIPKEADLFKGHTQEGDRQFIIDNTIESASRASATSHAGGSGTNTTTTNTTTATNSFSTNPNDCQMPFTNINGNNSSQCTDSALFNCSSQTMIDNFEYEKMNFSEMETVWIVKSWQEILVRVVLVLAIVLLGTLGNLTIIYSMCKFKSFRSKPTNIFILNMAIADLLTTIVCPNAALFTDIYQFYVLGSFICRFEGFIKSK